MKFLTTLCLAGILLCPAISYGALISTDFSTGVSGNNGGYFDVETGSNAVKITDIGIQANNTSTEGFKFFNVTGGGSFVGLNLSPGSWTNLFTGSVTGAAGSDGSNNHLIATPVDITDITLAANSTTGFYAIFTGGAGGNFLNYAATTGLTQTVASDTELTIKGGLGQEGEFANPALANRSAGIQLTYEVVSGTIGAVPEPASLAVFGLLGLGLICHRRRKNK